MKHMMKDIKKSLKLATVKIVVRNFCKKTWENHIKMLESAGFKVLEYFNNINDIYDECMVVYLTK